MLSLGAKEAAAKGKLERAVVELEVWSFFFSFLFFFCLF